MNTLNAIIEFFIDKKTLFSHKISLFTIVILSILIIDNIIGFSFYYNSLSKIEQVDKLNFIIKNADSDSTSIEFAKSLRQEIIERKNIFLTLLSLDYDLENLFKIDPNIKSKILFHLSSGGIYYILGIGLLPFLLISDNDSNLIERIGGGFLFISILFFMGWFMSLLLSIIPQLKNDTWVWNYVLNIGIQIFIIFIFTIKRKKKLSKK